jgi:hypothetical protein
MSDTNRGRTAAYRRRALFAGFAGLFGALVAVGGASSGCGGNAESYCEARCDCQGCSQREREDCADDVEDAERLATFDECATQYAEYLDCYVDEGSCESGGWVTATCAEKARALRGCSRRASAFVKSACEEELTKRESCGLTGGGSDPCTPDAECAAFCSLGASCDELANPQPGSTYAECASACAGNGSSSNSSSATGGSSGGSSGGAAGP